MGLLRTWVSRVAGRGAGRGAGLNGGLLAVERTVTITSDGASRSFLIRIPVGMPTNAGAVLAFHGGGGSNAALKSNIGLDALADLHQFAAVYPTTSGGNWTDGRASTAGGPNDILYTQDIIAWLGTNYGVSASKCFGIGISNGGSFLHWLSYNSPSTLAGFATVAANVPDSYVASITATGPRMTFHGTLDPLMLYAGGVNASLGPESWASALATIDRYGVANGGTTGVYTDSGLMPDTDPNDGCRWRTYTYTGTSHPVVHYRVQGGGHTWPGGTGTSGVGNKCTEFSATAEACNMFHSYGLW